MTIPEILNGTRADLKANIDVLAKDYFEKTGRVVCRSCPSDLNYMILSLKYIYKMTKFKFKRSVARYKNKPTDKEAIYQGNLTDEKAIEFLKTNPERIHLFASYPENWETLIIEEHVDETEAEVEARLAAEAEIEAANGGGEDLVDEAAKAEKEAAEAAEAAIAEGSKDVYEKTAESLTEANKEKVAEKVAEGNVSELTDEEKVLLPAEELMKLKLAELRRLFPEVKDNSIKGFVEEVVALRKQ